MGLRRVILALVESAVRLFDQDCAVQHARYVLQDKASSDYRGHKSNAIGYIDDAIKELQICMAMP